MTTWCVFVSSWARDAFAGKLVDHLSNSVTILFALSGVGTMRTRFPASYQFVLCALKGASSSRSFALIVATISFAGGRACAGGFLPLFQTRSSGDA